MRKLHLCLLLLFTLAACAPSSENAEAAVQAAVDAFHTALKTGDSKGAMALIAPDAVFIEAGNIETRQQYEENHLPADIEFEREIQSRQTTQRLVVEGDVAWVVLTSDLSGTFQGSEIALDGYTLMILSRQDGAWKIRSAHWSSRRR